MEIIILGNIKNFFFLMEKLNASFEEKINFYILFTQAMNVESRSQWPLGLRRRSGAARLLRSWVRIPPGTWMFVCCECLCC